MSSSNLPKVSVNAIRIDVAYIVSLRSLLASAKDMDEVQIS